MTSQETTPPAPKAKKKGRGAIVAVIVLVLVLGAVAAAAVVMGKNKKAADQDAAVQTRTAAVELTSLVAGFQISGTLGYGEAQELGGGGGVVTELPQAGELLHAGDVLMETEGMPVFIVNGEVPLWRELTPGMIGKDVDYLRQALTKLGLSAGQAGDQTYDEPLSSAIAKLYQDAGYPPPSSTPADQAKQDDAKKALDQAQEMLTQAQEAYDKAKKEGPSQAAKVAADNGVKEAERNLASARQGGSPAACGGTGGFAEAAAKSGGSAWSGGSAGSGLVISPAALVRDPTDPSTTPSESPSPTTPPPTTPPPPPAPDPNVIAACEDALRLAVAQRDDLYKPIDLSGQLQGITDAQKAVAEAQAAYDTAKLNTVGPQSILMIPTDEIRVDTVRAKIGQAAQGAVITWTATELYARIDLTQAQRQLIATGMAASVALPDGTELAGVVGDITEQTTDPATYSVVPASARIDIADQSALTEIGVTSVTVSFIQEETEETLVVPVTALMALAEGGYCVQLEDGRLIGVKVGLVADTRAQVFSDQLHEGDKVVVP